MPAEKPRLVRKKIGPRLPVAKEPPVFAEDVKPIPHEPLPDPQLKISVADLSQMLVDLQSVVIKLAMKVERLEHQHHGPNFPLSHQQGD